MSRLPLAPPAGRSPFGPDGVPQTAPRRTRRKRQPREDSTATLLDDDHAEHHAPVTPGLGFALSAAIGLLLGWLLGR